MVATPGQASLLRHEVNNALINSAIANKLISCFMFIFLRIVSGVAKKKTILQHNIVQSNAIIQILENQEAKRFIRQHINEDVAVLALNTKGAVDFDLSECLQLMKLYKKAQQKLPLYWQHLLALDARSYAQSTSEQVAQFKSTIFSGVGLLDLTAGLGVDSHFLSKNFQHVVAVDQNLELHKLARYNNAKMGIDTIHRVCAEANIFLTTTDDVYDLIYIDPDRRSDFGRSVALKYLSPNVLELLPLLRQKTNQLYIKLSPLFDVAEVYRAFDCVKIMLVIAERGEVKEVGVWLYFVLHKNNSAMRLVDVATGFDYSISTFFAHEKEHKFVLEKFFHLPLALVAKSSTAAYFLKDISYSKFAEFDVYCSAVCSVVGFRSFEVYDYSSLAQKKVGAMLKKHGVSKCVILIKGSAEKPDYWHKKWKTKDGGDVYLFLLRGKENKAFLTKFIS